ncbi:MAG TPA: carbonic anhydrase [Polyangiaceae bacterium]|nr:carbonic anhydrase [Polyangiaceae bacterium]
MGPLRLLQMTATLLLLASACRQPAAAITAEVLPQQAKEGKSRAQARANSQDGPGEQQTEPLPPKYDVPFAWGPSKGEPLELTRAFLKESVEDNKTYMERGPRFFSAFADAELPRATVVTCSDSRVQPQAWDGTSENDDYTVRNFGNTLAGDEASIEYGVEHLNTPLLLIIGHTGCGAVKAASGDTSKLSKAMQTQLKGLHIPRVSGATNENQAWAKGVLANVRNQVKLALKKYGKRVRSGSLTVIGAVFDFRDDLAQGAGKMLIVDVNGNGEPERIAAFMAAVEDGPAPSKSGSPSSTPGLAPEAALRSLEHVKGVITREATSPAHDSEHAGQHVD